MGWKERIGMALLIALTGMPSIASGAGKGTVEMRGLGPAYQVGRHDSRDRFCYDGSCILHGVGNIFIKLDPAANRGMIVATFKGPDGEWKVVQKRFMKIATNVNLHGAKGGDIDPKLSPPVLPQVWTYVATWGAGEVYRNGKLAWKGPIHLMVTEEVRDPVTGKVDYRGPMKAKEYPGSVHNPMGIQIHLVSHPKEGPVKGYLPPYKRFLHLMWDTVLWE